MGSLRDSSNKNIIIANNKSTTILNPNANIKYAYVT